MILSSEDKKKVEDFTSGFIDLRLDLLEIILLSAMGMAAESQFHVLAVDDSLFDRKLIERLLQKSSCQGNNNECFKKKS